MVHKISSFAHNEWQIVGTLTMPIEKSRVGWWTRSGHAAPNANWLLSKTFGINQNYRVLTPPSHKGVSTFHIK
jgi:hypothetical protein